MVKLIPGQLVARQARKLLTTRAVYGSLRSTGPQMRSVIDGLSLAPAVILVRPLHPGNIGAVARAMLNFGFSDLRLVAPSEQGWLADADAISMACEARMLLENAHVYGSVEEAVADVQLLFATAARPRAGGKSSLTPVEACTEAAITCVQGGRVGFMFGSERCGLRTVELDCAHALVSIPAQPGCSVLNLAQAVVVIAFQYWQARADVLRSAENQSDRLTEASNAVPENVAELATTEQLEGLLGGFRNALRNTGFLSANAPPEKEEGTIRRVRDFVLRARPTSRDINMLWGMLKAFDRRHRGSARAGE